MTSSGPCWWTAAHPNPNPNAKPNPNPNPNPNASPSPNSNADPHPSRNQVDDSTTPFMMQPDNGMLPLP